MGLLRPRLAFGLLPLIAVLSSCTSGIDDAPRDEACLQARYAVASAQLACGVDPQIANRAYETFGQTYACIASAVTSSDFECAERILETPCSEAVARPADDPAYVGSAAACGRLFRRADGAPFPLSTVPSKNPVCERLAHRYGSPLEACAYEQTNNQYGYGDDGTEPHEHLRNDVFAGRIALDASFVCLVTDPSVDPTACLDAIGCAGRTPPPPEKLLEPGSPCAALLGPIGATP